MPGITAMLMISMTLIQMTLYSGTLFQTPEYQIAVCQCKSAVGEYKSRDRRKAE